VTSTKTKDRLTENAVLMPGEERRRSQRVIIRMPVTVEVNIDGKSERSAAHTVAVNIHGAMLVCPRNLDADTMLQVHNERTRQKIEARVTRTPRETAEGFLIPIEFTSPAPEFWQISFPAANWKPSES